MLAAKPSSGMALLSAIGKAAHSGYIALAAIAGCSLEAQRAGHPATSRMNPALGFTEPGFVPSSLPQPLAKAAPAQAFIAKPLEVAGLKIIPLPAAPLRYLQ